MKAKTRLRKWEDFEAGVGRAVASSCHEFVDMYWESP
jgi:hypothetical protein